MSFRFTLRLGAVIAGTLVLGCNLSSSPVVVRIDGIRIAPARLSLLPYQAAGLTIDVTVTPVPVNAVTVTPAAVSLAVGDTATLSATLTDSSGSALFGRAITWSSSDPTVATVLVTGFVRGITAGTATITATCEGHSGTAVVTVKPGL